LPPVALGVVVPPVTGGTPPVSTGMPPVAPGLPPFPFPAQPAEIRQADTSNVAKQPVLQISLFGRMMISMSLGVETFYQISADPPQKRVILA
jgi:hypothetical protein